MISVFIAMFVFAFVGAITPGPVNIIATGVGARFGFSKTLPHIIGASGAYGCIVFLAGIGLNQVLNYLPILSTSLQYIGGTFLLYMSYKIATSTAIIAEDDSIKAPPTILEGVLAQSLNPKAWLVSMSGISLFVASQPSVTLYLTVFCLISFTVCFIGISTWAGIGHLIGDYLSTRKRQISFNIVMGLLLSSTVVSIFLNQPQV